MQVALAPISPLMLALKALPPTIYAYSDLRCLLYLGVPYLVEMGGGNSARL